MNKKQILNVADNNTEKVQEKNLKLDLKKINEDNNNLFLLSQAKFKKKCLIKKEIEDIKRKILDSYSKKIKKAKTYIPTDISIKNFTEAVSECLKKVNKNSKKYNSQSNSIKEEKGIHCTDSYLETFCQLKDSSLVKNKLFYELGISSLSNKHFWKASTDKLLRFEAKDNVLASDALNSFLEGLTICDCGTVLQASIHKAIEKMLGTDNYNEIFNSNFLPLIITSNLFVAKTPYAKDLEIADKLDFLKREQNYLSFLFDDVQESCKITGKKDIKIDESVIEIGDIIYLKGVKDYEKKHPPLVVSSGFHLICVDKNSDNEKLYMGFSSKFIEPLTLNQVKLILIDAYNLPQNDCTKNYLKESRALLLTKENITRIARATLYLELQNHKVERNVDNVVGVLRVMRFNPEKLKLLTKHKELNYKNNEEVLNNVKCKNFL